MRALAMAVLFWAGSVFAAPAQKDSKAADFSLKGADGKTYKLSDYKGKYVVLEWFNKDCPYIKKHYDGGNMQALQKEHTSKGGVWFSILSGKTGQTSEKEALQIAKDSKSNATALLLDPDGKVGHAYGAKTTPHMYVITPDGALVYNGAIDDQPSANPDSLKNAKNYVKLALENLRAGKKVETASNKPYGCSVKYE